MSIKVTPTRTAPHGWRYTAFARTALAGACLALLGTSAWSQANPTPHTGIAPPARMQNATAAAQPITLAQALAAARDNLDVQLARRNLAAAQADIRAANRAPLPVISGKFSQMDLQNGLGAGNVLTQKRIDKGVGIDWTWERGDKRALRTATAERAAAAAASDLDDVRVQQLIATWGAYIDLLAAQQRVSEVQAVATSGNELAEAARKRLKAGDLSAQDTARTEIEAQRTQADVTSAQLDAQRASVALSQLTRAPGDTLSPTLQASASDWPTQRSYTALPDAEVYALVEQRADVRAAAQRVEAARAALDSARALKRSDITVGTSVDHYPGTSTRLVELRASMPLQWGYGYEGEIGRAQALLDQAQDALDKTRLLAQLDLQRIRQELIAASERLRTYDADIVPRARRVAEQAEIAYNKGAIPLTDLLDARRTLRATLLDHLAARADHAKALGTWQLRTQPGTVPAAAP